MRTRSARRKAAALESRKLIVLIHKIKIRAILLGVATFLVLYFLFTLLANITLANSKPSHNTILLSSNLSLLTWIIAGYIGSLISKGVGIIHGLSIGIFSIVGVAITQFIFGGFSGFVYSLTEGLINFLLMGVILCGIGGIVWDLQSYINRRFSNP